MPVMRHACNHLHNVPLYRLKLTLKWILAQEMPALRQREASAILPFKTESISASMLGLIQGEISLLKQLFKGDI